MSAARRAALSLCLLAGLTCPPASARAADLGPAADAAPGVPGTRLQHWPRAAWAEKSKCWLAVWREGDLNERETDIWCARVSADGRTLDPAGIRIAGVREVQDRPVVASDGKDFLVAWQDLRNGRDWDIYAARVSGDGKVLDPDGFAADARPHNQCMPTLAFSSGNYLLAWQSWVEAFFTNGGGSYEVRGTRISGAGRVLSPEGTVLAGATAIMPSLASGGGDDPVLFLFGRASRAVTNQGQPPNRLGCLRIDPRAGTPLGEVSYIGQEKAPEVNFVPDAARMPDGSVLLVRRPEMNGFALERLDNKLQLSGGAPAFRQSGLNRGVVTMASVAGDGPRALVTFDFPTGAETVGEGPVHMKVWGWMASAEGEILDGGRSGFLIAGGEDVDCMQGVPCAGPEGTFLAVWAEARDVEDTKIAVRLVRPGNGKKEEQE